MLGVAAACAAFGLLSAAWLSSRVTSSTAFPIHGWPGTCKAMGSWFTAKERGT
jgi:sugar phosphate permease